MPDDVIVLRLNPRETAGEIERIVELLYESHRMIFPDKSINRESIANRGQELLGYLSSNSAILWGGFIHSRLEGFLWAFERIWIGERRLHVNEFAVSESHRGQGLGRRLLDAATTEARRLGVSSIDLLCSAHMLDTLRFYDKVGFVVERYQLMKRIDEES